MVWLTVSDLGDDAGEHWWSDAGTAVGITAMCLVGGLLASLVWRPSPPVLRTNRQRLWASAAVAMAVMVLRLTVGGRGWPAAVHGGVAAGLGTLVGLVLWGAAAQRRSAGRRPPPHSV